MKKTSLFLVLLFAAAGNCLLFSADAKAGTWFGAAPWDDSFFKAKGSEVISAASSLTRSDKGDIVVLLEEGRYSFDNEGRCNSSYRLVYRILTAAGASKWSNVESRWSPWHQNRPVLRARVVTPDGVEHHLAQETIIDGPEGDDSNDIFSDRRIVRAPLPAVTVGSVVEEEMTVSEKYPAFAAGEVSRFFFGRSVKTYKTRLVLDTPADRPLRHVVRLLPQLESSTSEKNGRTVKVFENGVMEPLQPLEPGLPGDQIRWPEIDFTTGKSWTEIAASYGEIVDRQIGQSDVSALVKEIVGDSRRREVIVEKLLAYLRKEVRYAGLEFGSGTIVPRTPSETLKQRYGDCKDQAALLVAMLRAAWVPAYVALLENGVGADIEPELPGLGGFNHAIVYIPGAPAVWIDPTAEFRPAGELPIGDQGRHAMIAGNGFDSLTVTPEARSSDNRQVETRELLLSEQGGVKVVETTTTYGSVGADYRETYSSEDAAATRKRLQKYTEDAYLTSDITELVMSDAKDLKKPFTLRIEVNPKEGYVDDEKAIVPIFPSIVVDRLPSLLKGGEKGDAEVRQHDYQMVDPHVYELRYHIVAPPGYKLQTLPESGSIPLGALAISKDFRLEQDGSVTCVLRLDAGKRRLSAAEVEATKKAVKLLKEQEIEVRFEQVGQSLLAAGKTREALAEFRRISSLHPKEALHHAQLADVLVELGLYGSARREAERAVDLEPKSYLAHRTLGWVLEHDKVGRLRGEGFDRNGALAEYKKAKALNPKDLTTRGSLGILLEFDPDGVRYSRKADLAGAIKEYNAIRSELKSDAFDQNLLICLCHARRWKELKTLSKSLKQSADRDVFLLTAIAADEGAPAAVKESKLLSSGATRQSTLEQAAGNLVQARRYREAADLLEEAAKGSANAASLRSRSNILKKVRHFDQAVLTAQEPTSVIKKMFLAVFVPKSAPEEFLSLFSSVVRDDVEKGRDTEFVRGLNFTKGQTEDATEVQADIVLSTVEFQVEGSDGTGYRINIKVPGAKEGSFLRAYVVKEKGQYRVLCSNKTPDTLGAEALRRIETGDLKGAMPLLEWARDELRGNRRSDDTFLQLWPADSPADREQMRLAAAALLLESNDDRVIPILLESRRLATGETLGVIDTALLDAYMSRKRYADVLQHCEKIAGTSPLSSNTFIYRAAALRGMDRWNDVRTGAEERLRTDPEDVTAMRILADCASERGDFQESVRLYKELHEAGSASASDYNELAWLGLFKTVELPEAVTFAERSASLSGEKSAAILHTLAALYAEEGKSSEARETILKSLAAREGEGPRPEDWYVLGRIAEAYGEMEEAREDYKKVAKPGKDTLASTSTYLLAQKRLSQK